MYRYVEFTCMDNLHGLLLSELCAVMGCYPVSPLFQPHRPCIYPRRTVFQYHKPFIACQTQNGGLYEIFVSYLSITINHFFFLP
jgi:hypothetical protein